MAMQVNKSRGCLTAKERVSRRNAQAVPHPKRLQRAGRALDGSRPTRDRVPSVTQLKRRAATSGRRRGRLRSARIRLLSAAALRRRSATKKGRRGWAKLLRAATSGSTRAKRVWAAIAVAIVSNPKPAQHCRLCAALWLAVSKDTPIFLRVDPG